jgi:hypothetical protein
MAGSLDSILYRLLRKGELPYVTLEGRTASGVTTLMKNGSGKILLATGTSVPADAGAGYAKGCLFIDTDVGAGSQGVYVNVGTITSCNFDVLGSVAAGSVGIADMTAITRGNLLVGGVAGAVSELVGKTAGKVICGDGTDVIAATMSGDATISAAGVVTIANAAVTSAKLDDSIVQYSEVAVTSANITDTAAGHLGHADGVVLVADPAATEVVELISAILIYDFAGAGYANGGNVTVNYNGGSAITGIVSAANSLGNAADQIINLRPLTTVGVALTKAKGLNLVAASAFTNGGSATGVIRIKTAYRVHTHGLA